MTDIADQTDSVLAVLEAQKNSEVERIRAAIPRGESLTHCLDCDLEIPEARRAIGGMKRCVECQTVFSG